MFHPCDVCLVLRIQEEKTEKAEKAEKEEPEACTLLCLPPLGPTIG